MSDLRRHPLEGGVGAAERPGRCWSVIVCPRQGRRQGRRQGQRHHPVHLRLGSTRVSGCACEEPQREPQQQEQPQARPQDGRCPSSATAPARVGRRPPLQRAFSLDRPPSPSGRGAWAAPLAPLMGLPLPTPAAPGAMEPPTTWMPSTRRLLLEPAPCRLRGPGPAVARLPYASAAAPAPTPAAALRPQGHHASIFHLPPAAFFHVTPGVGVGGGGGAEVHYELRPGSAPAAPSALALLSEHASRATTHQPGLQDARLEPAPAPTSPLRSQVLRVLRPEELEQRVPAGGANPTLPGAVTLPAAPLTVVPAGEADSGSAASAGGSSDEDEASLTLDVEMEPSSPKAAAPAAKAVSGKGLSVAEDRANRRQWLLRVVRENFNEQIGLLVERFVRRPRHDKSVRRVPGIGRKVNVNLQNFWKRNSGQERLMKTKDLLGVYSDSGMDWKGFQRWLTKDLQFMPSCAKLCALSLDIYQKYWSTDWDDAGTTG
ncbi:30S ribosomal protein S17 [Frankliniella fusca]|uniref:30S ribosomal protein S17 n=1 Tax=Frankliniella fusca TaxID=407009 RepID=A0AAE1LHB5_9NEOP|nr:30S ribosomal protein S17 [Frankliniella fusca]